MVTHITHFPLVRNSLRVLYPAKTRLFGVWTLPQPTLMPKLHYQSLNPLIYMLSKHIPIGVVFKDTSHIKRTRGVHYTKSRFLGGKKKMHDPHETMDYQGLLSNHDHSNHSQLSYAWGEGDRPLVTHITHFPLVRDTLRALYPAKSRLFGVLTLPHPTLMSKLHCDEPHATPLVCSG